MIIKLCLILLGIIFLHSIYFAVTALFVFFKNKTIVKHYKPKTKFCVLIAARNEEKVIGNLIKSLKKQDYPKELIDIYTLVNNCTDNTLEVAKRAGSKILEVKVKVKTKGEVLIYAIEKLKKTDYDAYLVFDADNVVDEKFASIMNDVYQSGYKIAQGRKDSQNATDNWISSSYSLFHYFQNFFYSKARTHKTWNATINGTGFMCDKKFIEEKYKPKTITEDVELALIATLNNEKVIYIDDAITYDEQPTKFKISLTQRLRWSKGIMQCFKTYYRLLLKGFVETGDFSYIDKIMFLLTPYTQVYSFLVTAILFIALVVTGLQADGLAKIDFSPVFNLTHFIIIMLISALFNILILKYYNNKILKNWHGILFFNLFIFTWVPLNVYCLFKKNVSWKPIEHGNKKAA